MEAVVEAMSLIGRLIRLPFLVSSNSPLAAPPPSPPCCFRSCPMASTIWRNAPFERFNSSYDPTAFTTPPSSITTRSTALRNCTWFVTKSRVRPSMSPPPMHSSNKCFPTCASTADKGSSSNTTCAGEYAARARLTLCR